MSYSNKFKKALFLLLFLSSPSHAFYQWQEDDFSLELNGLFRGFIAGLQNPDNRLFYSRKTLVNAGALGRFMLQFNSSNEFSLEAHLVQSYLPLSLQTGGSTFARLQGVERTALLGWRFANQRLQLEFDRLNIQYANDNFNLKIGRQPINLAATFFFTPNDFFSPFAAQTFYRAYKAGVDAARLDIQLGQLSQLSIISVLAYKNSDAHDTGWNYRPDFGNSSFLARMSTLIADFDLAILGGKVNQRSVIGIDFQGEVFEWLGVRGEGHIAFPNDAQQSSSIEFSLGLEHRFENTLNLRVEQFYHGSGADSVSEYAKALIVQRTSPYLARFYTALGASYEITPLLTGNATFLYNGVDSSSLLALYALYSLSDESEVALSVNLPFGDKPNNFDIKNEFGVYPSSFNIEYRLYF